MDGETECNLSETFVASDVKRILLSLSRLLKHTWHSQAGDNGGPLAGTLVSPDGLRRVPVHYRKNSLAIYHYGSVRCALQEGSSEEVSRARAWNSI